MFWLTLLRNAFATPVETLVPVCAAAFGKGRGVSVQMAYPCSTSLEAAFPAAAVAVASAASVASAAVAPVASAVVVAACRATAASTLAACHRPIGAPCGGAPGGGICGIPPIPPPCIGGICGGGFWMFIKRRGDTDHVGDV